MKNLYIPILVLLGLLGVFWLISDKTEQKPVLEEKTILVNNTNTMREINTIQGLGIKITKEGEGAEAKVGDNVSVHYTGKFENGEVFDSSVARGEPFMFPLGGGRVIQGWDLGVAGMKVGEKRELTISSDLAYGDQGVTAPNGQVVIPEKATLIFEVELLAIN